MSSAMRAVFKTCRLAIIAEGTITRVYYDAAPGDAVLPFLVGFHVGGGAMYEHQVNDQENVRLRWIAQGATMAEADNAINVVQTVLNKKGTQQATSGTLDGSSEGWEITIARKGNSFYPPGLDESRELYRAGFDIDYKCERTS